MSSVDLDELVEDLMAYVPLPPSGQRRWHDSGCLSYQPGPIAAYANVSAVRATPATIGALAGDAAQFFGELGRTDFLWFVGPRSTPVNCTDAVAGLGASVVGSCTALALDHEPPQMPGIEIRPVAATEDLLAYRQIALTAEIGGALTDSQAQQLATSNNQAWHDYSSYRGRRRNYLAYLDGEAVSAGGLLLTEHGVAVLSGAGTLPSARGRGLYRALVHARWVAAQQLGVGTLAVQASHMSSPVLIGLGFARLADMQVLRQPV